MRRVWGWRWVASCMGNAPRVPMPEWKQAAMASRKHLLLTFQRTVGSPGWNWVVPGETWLSGEVLATVGGVDTARPAPLPGVQALDRPMGMDGAANTDGCLQDGSSGLGPSAGVEAPVLNCRDGHARADGCGRGWSCAMEVDVAVDEDGCLMVEPAGSVPAAGRGRGASTRHSEHARIGGCGRLRAVR